MLRDLLFGIRERSVDHKHSTQSSRRHPRRSFSRLAGDSPQELPCPCGTHGSLGGKGWRWDSVADDAGRAVARAGRRASVATEGAVGEAAGNRRSVRQFGALNRANFAQFRWSREAGLRDRHRVIYRRREANDQSSHPARHRPRRRHQGRRRHLSRQGRRFGRSCEDGAG